MFAPTVSEKVSNWILASSRFTYDARIPALANDFLKGRATDAAAFLDIARAQDASVTLETLGGFSERYINALGKSYHLGFGVACISLDPFHGHLLGLSETLRPRRLHRAAEGQVGPPQGRVVNLTPQETKERLLALGLVFFVVIFFWMAFQQSAATMTFFARDYTVPSVGKVSNLWLDLVGLLSISLAVLGLILLLRKGRRSAGRDRRRFPVRGLHGRGHPPVQRVRGRQSLHAPAISSTSTPSSSSP